MEQKELKTSWKQRLLILVVAVLLLGGTVLTYVFIVLNGNAEISKEKANDDLIAQLNEEYAAKSKEVEEAAKPLSEKYFADFKKFKSEIKAFNSANANAAGLETKDLKNGTGRKLNESDNLYYAYYVGWCPDGKIFDSSFDNADNPTALKAPLDASIGLIEGWNQGIAGMKVGGIREITMSSELAYGESTQPCGTANTPLKFIVMPIEVPSDFDKLSQEKTEISIRIMSAVNNSSN